MARVTGRALPAAEFSVATPTGDRPVLEAVQHGHYHRDAVDDPEHSEYFVPVRWLDTAPLERAVREIGFFGNQNTVCRPTAPRWRSTVDRLRAHFSRYDAA